MIRKLTFIILLILTVGGSAPAVMAGNTAVQVIRFEVQEINEISINGNSGPLVVRVAKNYDKTVEVKDSSSTYNITTNATNKKISANIDNPMPDNTVLKLSLSAPPGASSSKGVILSTSFSDLVSGIGKVAAKNIGMDYIFSVDPQTKKVPPQERIVTLVITDM